MNVDDIPARTSRRPASSWDSSLEKPLPEDVAWEGELLAMFSPLEAARVKLEQACQEGLALAALEAMTAMVAHVADFASQNPMTARNAVLKETLKPLSEGYLAEAQQLQDRLRPSAYKMLLQVFGWRSDTGDPHAQFVAAATQLPDLLRQYFQVFTERFQSPHGAHGWVSMQAVFLGELLEMVQRLKT